jgi:5S rRNA maturation endonuclease (ribonuclease M5)
MKKSKKCQSEGGITYCTDSKHHAELNRVIEEQRKLITTKIDKNIEEIREALWSLMQEGKNLFIDRAKKNFLKLSAPEIIRADMSSLYSHAQSLHVLMDEKRRGILEIDFDKRIADECLEILWRTLTIHHTIRNSKR